MSSLRKKVVWVTGASSGIGEALARALAARGAQLEGMAPERCAERIVRAIERRRDEVLIGGRERFAVHLQRFLPGLFNRLIRRVRVT